MLFHNRAEKQEEGSVCKEETAYEELGWEALSLLHHYPLSAPLEINGGTPIA